jgi:hypothetical protein
MVVDRGGVVARAQDTVVVVHHTASADVAVVTTRLTTGDGSSLHEQTERVWIRADGDGLFTLNLDVPEPDLGKGAPWTVHVLLAPGARHRGQSDFEQDPAMDGGRVMLVWTGEADPKIPVIWNYFP